MLISDIVLLEELPAPVRSSIEAYVGCVAGASLKQDYLRMIETAGFENIQLQDETAFFTDVTPEDPVIKDMLSRLDVTAEELARMGRTVVSVKISAVKPPSAS
jgi:hypothetical protein